MLQLNIKGEVYNDLLQRGIYATDASMYQMLPDLVAVPKDEEDLLTIVNFSSANKIPILARGSGTSLAGQAVNKGIVIDFTKYFNHIIAYDPANQTATVQPGVSRDQLNALVLRDGLHFAPDPATSNRCTFGGMIANNSSGTKSILYGKTSDYVKELRVMLMDGSILSFNALDQDAFDKKCNQKDAEGELYKTIREIIFANSDEIKVKFPKVLRSVTGYGMDQVFENGIWNPGRLIVGSEGTLAIILESKVGLTPLPKFQNLAVIHFSDRKKGIEAVKHIVEFGPAAVEVLDYNVLQQSKNNPITKKYHDNLIKGDPDLVLTVEFYGDTLEEIQKKESLLSQFIEHYPTAYHWPTFYDKDRINDALNLRKDGLGILMGKVAAKKPQAFVEDSAIPLEHLADYIENVYQICKSVGIELVIYAHASVGVLHIRPILDVTNSEDIEKMKYISDQCFQLVKKYGGSWSGEHGDGRNRGPRIKDFYGEQIYDAFKGIKNAFDPENLLNPNIIINTPPMDQNMRYGPTYIDKKQEFLFHYRKDHSFQDLVHMCSGVGACRKKSEGTMCPSFRATGDEKDSTRGRANVLRLAMSGQMGFVDLSHPDVKEVMDLCLSCKACKSECPSNVDMAKLKSEVLQISYDKTGASFAEKLPKLAPKMAKILSGKLAPLVNKIQKTKLFKLAINRLGHIHQARNLPEYASETLAAWYAKNNGFASDQKVVLFADTYINYHEVDLGKDVVRLLNSCGYEVLLAEVGCCQRPLISNGFLRDAKTKGTKTIKKLAPFIEQGLPILVVEPSCHSALLIDLPDLLDDEATAEKLSNSVSLVEDFLAKEIVAGKIKGKFVSEKMDITVHGHCHQKALGGLSSMQKILSLSNIPYNIIDAGCCGMAGAFGYESHHYDISLKIAEERLIPALNKNKEASVCANGFSCRHQIKDLTDRNAKHIFSLLKYESND